MVAAKIGGADKIVAENVFDEEVGLLGPGGTPSVLFLPWRTTALALRGADYIGSFNLPERSKNYVFARKGEAAIVAWNDEPVDEDLALDDDAIVTDVLGRRIRRNDTAAGQPAKPGKLRIGPSPLVIRHFSEPMARWITEVSFEKGRLPSKTGKQKEAIRGVNTFRHSTGGTLRITVPKDWKVDQAELRFSLQPGEQFVWPIALELPSNTSQGRQQFILDFATSNGTIRVYRDYEVGLGDVVLSVTDAMLPNGDLQIKQTIDNRTDERLSFQCDLYIPGYKRMQRMIARLTHNRDTVVYVVPGAAALKGTELQLRAKQIGGQRILNCRWKVGESWDEKKKAANTRNKGTVRE
jgi:hypothetical protein